MFFPYQYYQTEKVYSFNTNFRQLIIVKNSGRKNSVRLTAMEQLWDHQIANNRVQMQLINNHFILFKKTTI